MGPSQYIFDESAGGYEGLTSIGIAKRELWAYRCIERAIEREEWRLAELKARIASPSSLPPSSTLVQVSPGDSMAEALANILDHESEVYRTEIAELLREKYVVLRAIDSIKDPYSQVLAARYTKKHRTMSECVSELGYTYDHLCRLHGKALELYARQRGFPKKDHETWQAEA